MVNLDVFKFVNKLNQALKVCLCGFGKQLQLAVNPFAEAIEEAVTIANNWARFPWVFVDLCCDVEVAERIAGKASAAKDVLHLVSGKSVAFVQIAFHQTV